MATFSDRDREFMRRALRLAARGRGRVSPNPMVGAVLVRNGRVVGEGWHRRFGGPHAEVEAFRRAGGQARGATLYVTLEPCAHTGKTPPCTEAVLAAGVVRVVAAMRDPNPAVRGGGCRILARRGLAVSTGLLAGEAAELNRGFLTRAKKGRPLVTLKIAASLDGGIAGAAGDSKWITGPAARREAHRLRAEHDAVVVGAGTVRADDPALTVRQVRGMNPARVVLDPRLSTSPRARWIEADGARRIVVMARAAAPRRGPAAARARLGRGAAGSTRALTARRTAFERAGAEVWEIPADAAGMIRLRPFLARAAKEGITSLLVEGGGRLAGAFLAAGLADRLRLFTAPLLLGRGALRWTDGLKGRRVKRAPRLNGVRVARLGDDWIVEGEF